jgi:hypothetical protein
MIIGHSTSVAIPLVPRVYEQCRREGAAALTPSTADTGEGAQGGSLNAHPWQPPKAATHQRIASPAILKGPARAVQPAINGGILPAEQL